MWPDDAVGYQVLGPLEVNDGISRFWSEDPIHPDSAPEMPQLFLHGAHRIAPIAQPERWADKGR